MQTTTRGECPGDPAHVQMRPGARWSPLISDVPDCEQEVCLLIAIWKSLLPGFMSLFPWLIFHIASMFDFKEHIYLSYSPGQVLCVPPSEVSRPLISHTSEAPAPQGAAAVNFFSLRDPESITWTSLPFRVCFCVPRFLDVWPLRLDCCI